MLYLVFTAFLALTKSQTLGPAFPCPGGTPSDDCSCNYDLCTWAGDPHQTSFDGTHYHFQGATDEYYRYVSSCTSDEIQVPFQVLALHGSCPSSNPGVTCSNEVQIRLYDTSTGNYDRTLTIDTSFNVQDSATGSAVNIGDVVPYGAGSEYARPSANRIEIFTGYLCGGRADLILYGHVRNMNVEINDYYLENVCGLCGFYNNAPADDFLYSTNPPTSPYTDCLQQTLPGTTSMWSYSPTDWFNVDTFGAAWIDFGTGIRRRLQREQFTDPDFTRKNFPQNDPERREAALRLVEELFPEQRELPFFVDDCADDGQFVCQEIEENCIRQVCNQLIPQEPEDPGC